MTTWMIVAFALGAGPAAVVEGVSAPEVGQRGWLLLEGGEVRAGKVVRIDRERLVLLAGDTPATFKRSAVLGIVTADVAYGDPVGDGRHVRLVLEGGLVRSGRTVALGPAEYVIEGPAGTERYPASEVLAAVVPRETAREVDVWTQGLAGLPASLLRAGELRLGFAGAGATAEGGLTSFLTLGVGSTFPVGYASEYPANFRAWLRGGVRIGGVLVLSGGPVVEVDRAGTGALYLSGAAALGTEAFTAGVYVGPRFAAAEGIAPLGEVAFSARASVRLMRGIEALGEVWSSREGGFGLAGVRWRWRRFAVTAAAAGLGAGTVTPWVGFALDATPWRIAP